jgi:hypothetical protein
VYIQAFLTSELERDGKLASSLGQPSVLIKTKVSWQSCFYVYINSIFQKLVGDGGKAPHILTLTFSECEWSTLRSVCFTHRIWCCVENEPDRNALEKKLSFPTLGFPTRLPWPIRKWRSLYTDWAVLSIKQILMCFVNRRAVLCPFCYYLVSLHLFEEGTRYNDNSLEKPGW